MVITGSAEGMLQVIALYIPIFLLVLRVLYTHSLIDAIVGHQSHHEGPFINCLFSTCGNKFSAEIFVHKGLFQSIQDGSIQNKLQNLGSFLMQIKSKKLQ
jgi:hypothetical protein